MACTWLKELLFCSDADDKDATEKVEKAKPFSSSSSSSSFLKTELYTWFREHALGWVGIAARQSLLPFLVHQFCILIPFFLLTWSVHITLRGSVSLLQTVRILIGWCGWQWLHPRFFFRYASPTKDKTSTSLQGSTRIHADLFQLLYCAVLDHTLRIKMGISIAHSVSLQHLLFFILEQIQFPPHRLPVLRVFPLVWPWIVLLTCWLGLPPAFSQLFLVSFGGVLVWLNRQSLFTPSAPVLDRGLLQPPSRTMQLGVALILFVLVQLLRGAFSQRLVVALLFAMSEVNSSNSDFLNSTIGRTMASSFLKLAANQIEFLHEWRIGLKDVLNPVYETVDVIWIGLQIPLLVWTAWYQVQWPLLVILVWVYIHPLLQALWHCFQSLELGLKEFSLASESTTCRVRASPASPTQTLHDSLQPEKKRIENTIQPDALFQDVFQDRFVALVQEMSSAYMECWTRMNGVSEKWHKYCETHPPFWSLENAKAIPRVGHRPNHVTAIQRRNRNRTLRTLKRQTKVSA